MLDRYTQSGYTNMARACQALFVALSSDFAGGRSREMTAVAHGPTRVSCHFIIWGRY
jgi:hypothetical protein